MLNLPRRRIVPSLFRLTIIILVTMLILILSAVMNRIMPKIATNASNSSTLAIDCTYSTSSTPATITDTTILSSTPSAIAGSSIDLYQAWVKNFTCSSMGFPLPDIVVTPETIFETQWAPELWRHLSELDTKYVSLCIGNSAYKESIVNWLIAALVITQPPLENVLVISLDTELHEFLQEHDINSVYVDPWTIVRSNVELTTKLAFVWLTRLVLYRLINHWGYTVATYDSDAIPVKNPQTLFAKFEDSDLVGSRGTYPHGLSQKWKSATMCMGMALFKASKATEVYWNFLSTLKLSREKISEQYIINTGFDECGIKWNINKKQSSITGRCSTALDLKISLVSTDEICRHCDDQHNYYVKHQLTNKILGEKMTAAKEGGVWFLKKKHFDHTVKFKGSEWLRFLNSD